MMTPALTVLDKTSQGAVTDSCIFEFPPEQSTVAGLIAARVTQEVEVFNAGRRREKSTLVRPDTSDMNL